MKSNRSVNSSITLEYLSEAKIKYPYHIDGDFREEAK